MITDLNEIESSALNVNKRDKARLADKLLTRLADKLLQSIHGKIDPEIEQSWMVEVQKRKEALTSGEASRHSRSDELKEARKRIQK